MQNTLYTCSQMCRYGTTQYCTERPHFILST